MFFVTKKSPGCSVWLKFSFQTSHHTGYSVLIVGMMLCCGYDSFAPNSNQKLSRWVESSIWPQGQDGLSSLSGNADSPITTAVLQRKKSKIISSRKRSSRQAELMFASNHIQVFFPPFIYMWQRSRFLIPSFLFHSLPEHPWSVFAVL